MIPGCSQLQADIVFVIDSSNKVGGNFNSILEFVSRVVQQFTVDQNYVRVGVVSFASSARNDMYLNERRNVASDVRSIG